MNGFCRLAGISSTAWKACIPKSQFLRARVITVANAKYYQLPATKIGSSDISNSNRSSNRLNLWSHENLPLLRKFSTSSCQLSAHQGHDHSKIWSFERVLSLLLVPTLPAALLSPCQQLDTALAVLIVLHVHFGLEAIIVDYIRPILFGEMAPKVGMALLYVFSIITLAGLLNLIYNDCGLANTVISIWKK